MSEISENIRRSFLENDLKRDAGLTTPENILRYDNIAYGEDPKFQLLDIYTLKDYKDKNLPVIINVHGGGYVYGFKETYQYYCMNLAQRGFKVVNFSYRLAPEAKFPAQLEDINKVFHWIKDNAKEFSFDLNHLFGIGDSAGANLLGIYAGILSDKKLNKFKFILPDLNLKAVCFNHGSYNNKLHNDNLDGGLTNSVMTELFTNGGTEEELDLINVANYINKNFPPTFIVSSSDDFLRDQPIYLIKALTDNTIGFIYRFFVHPNKPLNHVFHLDIRTNEAKVCNDEECNFFKTFLV